MISIESERSGEKTVLAGLGKAKLVGFGERLSGFEAGLAGFEEGSADWVDLVLAGFGEVGLAGLADFGEVGLASLAEFESASLVFSSRILITCLASGCLF